VTLKESWRFIDYSSDDPYMNLAIEETMARSILEKNSPNALRVWQHPLIVSVGCNQRVEKEVNVDYCKQKGIKIVRRLSGGGAVYQDSGNLNYSLYIDTNKFRSFKDPIESYSYLCRGLIIALKLLGLEAEFKPVNDIVIGKRKISGNAQHQLHNVLIHHGTLLIDLNFENLENALRVSTEKLRDKNASSVRDRVTTIKRELGTTIPVSIVKNAVRRGYQEALGVEFQDSKLTPEELEMARELQKKYSSPEWIFGSSLEFEHETVYKAPGGLIRVSLNISNNNIKEINISGDFFITPPQALKQLEKMLKDKPYNYQNIKQIVEDFYKQNIITPGIKPTDLIVAIMQAKTILP